MTGLQSGVCWAKVAAVFGIRTQNTVRCPSSATASTYEPFEELTTNDIVYYSDIRKGMLI
jgi:hypothetical protein